MKIDGSSAGSIEYRATEAPDVFEVTGSYRVGKNGGVVLIGEDDQAPTPPPAQPELPQVPATSLCDLVKAVEHAERLRLDERRRREAIVRESRDMDNRECDGQLEAILAEFLGKFPAHTSRRLDAGERGRGRRCSGHEGKVSDFQIRLRCPAAARRTTLIPLGFVASSSANMLTYFIRERDEVIPPAKGAA